MGHCSPAKIEHTQEAPEAKVITEGDVDDCGYVQYRLQCTTKGLKHII